MIIIMYGHEDGGMAWFPVPNPENIRFAYLKAPTSQSKGRTVECTHWNVHTQTFLWSTLTTDQFIGMYLYVDCPI